MKKQVILLICFLTLITLVVIYALVKRSKNEELIEQKVNSGLIYMERQDSTIAIQQNMLRHIQSQYEKQQSRISDLEKVLYEKDSLILKQKQTIYSQNRKINEIQKNLSPIPHSDLEKRYKPD